MRGFLHVVVDSPAVLQLDTVDDAGTTRLSVTGRAGERIILEIRHLERLDLGTGPTAHPLVDPASYPATQE